MSGHATKAADTHQRSPRNAANPEHRKSAPAVIPVSSQLGRLSTHAIAAPAIRARPPICRLLSLLTLSPHSMTLARSLQPFCRSNTSISCVRVRLPGGPARRVLRRRRDGSGRQLHAELGIIISPGILIIYWSLGFGRIYAPPLGISQNNLTSASAAKAIPISRMVSRVRSPSNVCLPLMKPFH
jgi:hypothetical protein